MRLVLRALERIIRWTTARDCTCGMSVAPDYMHAPGCAHPLRRQRR